MEKNKIDIFGALQREVQKCISIEHAKRRFPICVWLPKYNLECLFGDFIAGLTVGFTILPQSIAYAMLAGLPSNFGLYSAYIGMLVYVFLGSTKQISIGPAAIMSMLTFEYAKGNPDVATLLSFTTGLIVLSCSILNLGFLVSFVSKPVTAGFVSAAAITVASSQIRRMLGIQTLQPSGLVDTWVKIIGYIKGTRWPDFIMGIASVIVLLSMKKMGELKRFQPSSNDSIQKKSLNMVVFLISVSKNAIVVGAATIIAASLGDHQPFSVAGHIESGLPTFQTPKFTTNNGTTSFREMIASAGEGVFVLPLVAILENISIANTFSKGKLVDATQEMYAIGISNLIGSFFHAYPTAASFSRAGINNSSGVRTPAGGIVTAAIVLTALAVLTPYFKLIPLSSLGAVIICAVIFMIQFHAIVPIWKVRKTDELVVWVTFLVCTLWKIQYGLPVGIITNALILLYKSAFPKVEVTPVLTDLNVPPHIIITSRIGLMYVNVGELRKKTTEAALEIANGTLPVIIDCTYFSDIDYSASWGMRSLCDDFENRSQPLLFMNVSYEVQRGLIALNPFIQIVEKDSLIKFLKKLEDNHTIGRERYTVIRQDSCLNDKTLQEEYGQHSIRFFNGAAHT